MQQSSDFSIRTDVFEGPLELLLDLIEKRKLLINDISLAAVTDEYMEHVSELEERSMGSTAHFVLVASTLLLIKSKSLLPVLVLSEDEEESIDDLEARLKLYQIFRDAGKDIQQQCNQAPLYSRRYTQRVSIRFRPDAYTQTNALSAAIVRVLEGLPKSSAPEHEVAVKKIASLEETMKNLESRITRQLKLSFQEFSGDATQRPQLIVNFLAVLELVKQGLVMVEQERRFEDIAIARERVDTPSYN